MEARFGVPAAFLYIFFSPKAVSRIKTFAIAKPRAKINPVAMQKNDPRESRSFRHYCLYKRMLVKQILGFQADFTSCRPFRPFLVRRLQALQVQVP